MFFKLCGLTRQEDLDLAGEQGFALCGFVFHEKSPRYCEPAQAASLRSPGLVRTGVFVEKNPLAILQKARLARLDLIQLHGDQDADCLRVLSRETGADRLIRVLWPERFASKAAFEDALGEAAESCALVLLDAGTSGGGHGKGLDPDLLVQTRFPLPWILAGGLSPESLDAVASLPESSRPVGLDFNSRLESAPGVKDPVKVRVLVELAKALGLGPDPLPPHLFPRAPGPFSGDPFPSGGGSGGSFSTGAGSDEAASGESRSGNSPGMEPATRSVEPRVRSPSLGSSQSQSHHQIYPYRS